MFSAKGSYKDDNGNGDCGKNSYATTARIRMAITTKAAAQMAIVTAATGETDMATAATSGMA